MVGETEIGKRSVGKPHAAFDEAGAGNGRTAPASTDHSDAVKNVRRSVLQESVPITGGIVLPSRIHQMSSLPYALLSMSGRANIYAELPGNELLGHMQKLSLP